MDNLSPYPCPHLHDVLVKQILLSHDPDGRDFDSQPLLQLTESIMHHATASQDQVSDIYLEDLEFDVSEESLQHIIRDISFKMFWDYEDKDLHGRTLILFDFLSKYKWDAKLALVLAALMTSYGKVWVIQQSSQHNPLAVAMRLLKQLPDNWNPRGLQLKALSMLIKTMKDLTETVSKFEGLSVTNGDLLNKETTTAKSNIYNAAYWVIRSALTCSAQMRDLMGTKNEQVPANSATRAVWELSSLTYKLDSICSYLRKHVDDCQRKLEMNIHLKLQKLFKGSKTNNQEVLRILFSLRDPKPLKKGYAQDQLGISELNNKVVLLLHSKLDLCEVEELVLLLQQIQTQPDKLKPDKSYEIVWVPIPSSQKWTKAERKIFKFLSNSFPWYFFRQPQLLNPAVVNYIVRQWNFSIEPIMVVLDAQGSVKNTNAIPMVLIWGDRAYPFSDSKEEELWGEEKWNLQLITNQVDPLLTFWVDEGKNICIFGSDNLNWIRQLCSMQKEIEKTRFQLELVFVGTRTCDEKVRNILATIEEENLSSSLSFRKMQIFWLRLEKIRKSKDQLKNTAREDHILEEAVALLEFEYTNEGWALMGTGPFEDVLTLYGSKVMECLDLFPEWGGKVTSLGLLGAVRTALYPTGSSAHCGHSYVIQYGTQVTEGGVFCQSCLQPMEKSVVFECNVKE